MSSGKKVYKEPGDSLQEALVKEEDSELDIYDPFESPPNFVKADRHHSGMSIGLPVLQTGSIKDIEVCPCCENPINKQPISICCNEDELLFLGVGYPLYFKLAKYITAMVILVFVASGSGLSYLLTVDCEDKCLSWFGFTIIDFEIEEELGGRVELMNMATALIILVAGVYAKSLIKREVTSLESKVVCPSQYTIMLQNLPRNFEEFELRKWVKQTFQHEAVSINICYNVQKLQQAYQTRNHLTIQLRKLQIKRMQNIKSELKLSSFQKMHYMPDESFQDEREKELSDEIQKQDRVIHDYRNNMVDVEKNGTAFVTFDTVQTVVDLLDTYEQVEIVSFLTSTMASVMTTNALQFKARVVKVSRAPAPRQVIWENLEYSHLKSFAYQVFFVGSMLTLIYFAFQYQFRFSAYAYNLRQESKSSQSALLLFQAVVASLIVLLVNSLLRIIILIFTKLKRHHSHTAQQSSFCFYYTLLYVLNSCFTIYIIHGQYPQESSELLLYDIHIIMLANAFSEPLFKLLDPFMWHKVIMKRYIRSLAPSKNPYTQMYVHKYFEGYEISNGDNYQYIARILIVAFWFAHAAPLGVLFCVVGMGVDYWVGKVLLLKVYKKPQNISKSIASFIINTFQLLPLIYICGVLQFTYKSTSSNASLLQFLTNFFNYSITVTILIICILGYLLFFNTTLIPISSTPYSHIKKYFGFNYQTENPITKFRGEINYLQNVIKSLKGGAWMNVRSKEDIDLMNQLCQFAAEPDARNKVKADLAKVKISMQNSREFQNSDDDDIELQSLSDKHKRSNELRYSLSSDSSNDPSPHLSQNCKKKKDKFTFKRTLSIMR